jgi:SAM-dependent methyltransferase
MRVNWPDAQVHELEIWRRTVAEAADVLSEIQEAAGLVKFGAEHGVGATVSSVIELGVGPMGIGWGAFGKADRIIGIDSLPRLRVVTGDSSLDTFCEVLQGRIEYLQADATTRLPFADGSFDLVVCDNVVDHTQDPTAVLAEAYRLTAPAGRLLFGVNTFSAAGLIKWRQITRRMHPRSSNVLCHPHSFHEDNLEVLLGNTGWTIRNHHSAPLRQRTLGSAYRVRLLAGKDQRP